MRLTTISLIYAAILLAAYFAGRRKATALVQGRGSTSVMHSLPSYHGYHVMLWGAVPALLAILFYLSFGDSFAVSRVTAGLPEALGALPQAELNLVINDIKNLAAGNTVSGQPDAAIVDAANHLGSMRDLLSLLLLVLVGNRRVLYKDHF